MSRIFLTKELDPQNLCREIRSYSRTEEENLKGHMVNLNHCGKVCFLFMRLKGLILSRLPMLMVSFFPCLIMDRILSFISCKAVVPCMFCRLFFFLFGCVGFGVFVCWSQFYFLSFV